MAAVEPLSISEAPRSVVQNTQSDAGQLQSSVSKWAKEVSLALRNIHSTVQTLKTAAATPAVTTAAATTSTPSVQQVVEQAGLNGWSPMFALQNYAGAVIMKLVGWTGGTGTAPASGLYIGPGGFVSNPGAATNLIGPAASAGGITAQLVFSATSTTAPPPTGGVIFDNATFGSIANIYASNVDRNGTSISLVLGQIGVGSLINVFQQSPTTTYTFATFVVTAAITHSGYYQFTVTPLSGQVLPDVQPVGFSFTCQSGSTGGAPSGPAGGDLTGTYPNPNLAAIGSVTGPLPSTAARVPVVTIDTKGRVTALTDEAITGVPYANITGTPSSLPPSGPAGGDLTGTYPNPGVQAINGQKIAGLSNGILTNVGGVPSVIVQPTGAVVGTTDVQTLTNKSIGATQLTGTLQAAQFPALTGDVTTVAGALATTIAANAVTNAKLAQMAGKTIKGNASAGTANAADLTALPFAIAPSSPNAQINWNLRYFVEDYATVQLALTAAANAHGVLMLPPGITDMAIGTSSLGLQLPGSFTGYFGIMGCGSKVSILRQSNAANGLTLDLSAANPAPNSFIDTGANLRGFSVLSNNSGCKRALYVTYGTVSPGSISGKLTGSVEDVEVLGGGWQNGIYLLNVWGWKLNGIYASGDSGDTGSYIGTLTAATALTNGQSYVITTLGTTVWSTYGLTPANATTMIYGQNYSICVAGTVNWTSIGAGASTPGTSFMYNGGAITGSGGTVARQGQLFTASGAGTGTGVAAQIVGIGNVAPGSGAGITFDSCINCRLVNSAFEWWQCGLYIPTGSGPVGPSQGIQVNTIEMLECINCFNSNGTLYVGGILFDNGNLYVGSKASIVIQGSGSMGSQITGGQVLQNGGVNAVQLNNTLSTKLTGLDFEFMSSLTGYVIRMYTGTGSSNVTGCTGGGNFCQLDSGSTSNKVIDNGQGLTNLDNGTGNTVGDVLGFSIVQALAGGASFSFSISAAAASLGKKATAAPIQVVDPSSGYKVVATYDYSNAGNNSTTAFFVAQNADLTTLPTGSFRFSGTIAP